jgi:sugar lactone lactonase YvrE
VLADEAGDRLFVADSNNNRIVIAMLDGTVTDIVGDGEIGLRDGSYDEARFFRPQGMSLDGDLLYVADTENHALRAIDLKGKSVTTLVGTGVQQYLRAPSYDAKTANMNSPWDVLAHGGKVYIAMAGQHQIWLYDPVEKKIREFAGSRREELKDGPRLSGGLNQPSGLATDGNVLYIADSEASAIRAAGLAPDGELDTIVGTGLFDFGDVDSRGREVRLQHPLGVVFHRDTLYVADTYNSKIKRVDPKTREAKTFAGGNGELDEPGGLSLAGGRLYVADTNHHRIKTVDLASGQISDLPLTVREP